MTMHNPPHPGEFIREVYLEPFEITGRQLSTKLGVSPSTLNRILKGNSRHKLRNGTSSFQGLGTLSRELAGYAGQLRSLACQANSQS